MANAPQALATAWRLEGAVRSHVGRVRTENQDAFGFFPDLGLFVVADGLGGHEGGRQASTLAVDVVRDNVAATDDEDLTPMSDRAGLVSLGARRLLAAIVEANGRVRDAGRELARRGMGTTVAALLFDAVYGVVAVCHVGDSRVFRFRDGQLQQLTEDHTVVQQWVKEGRIQPEDAASSPHRHMITQAVGTQESVRPDVRLERPVSGDVYVLTSDGIHDQIAADEMAAALNESRGDLETACLRLIEMANARGGRDNSTVLLVRCASSATDDEPTVAS
jgi:serine/threonine protein phosphatase PrpC